MRHLTWLVCPTSRCFPPHATFTADLIFLLAAMSIHFFNSLADPASPSPLFTHCVFHLKARTETSNLTVCKMNKLMRQY